MGRAQIGYFDVDVTTPNDVLRISDAPVLSLGELGCFDDAGVTSSWIVNHRGRKYLYYSGWTRGVSIPFLFLHRAGDQRGRRPLVSKNLTCADPREEHRRPVPDRIALRPHRRRHLAYVVCLGHRVGAGAWKPHAPLSHQIRRIEGRNPLEPERARGASTTATADEYAIARPTVIKDGRTYRMWFCCRGDAYRLGYAESSDGIRWKRDDTLAGLAPSAAGWDSEIDRLPVRLPAR